MLDDITKDFACLQCKYRPTWQKSLCPLNPMGLIITGCTSHIDLSCSWIVFIVWVLTLPENFSILAIRNGYSILHMFKATFFAHKTT